MICTLLLRVLSAQLRTVLYLRFHEELVPCFSYDFRQLGRLDVVHPLVMNQNLGGQALEHPHVAQGVVGRQSGVGVPLEAPFHEVQEVGVFVADQQTEGLAARLPQFSPRVLEHNGLIVAALALGEELRTPLRHVVDFSREGV